MYINKKIITDFYPLPSGRGFFLISKTTLLDLFYLIPINRKTKYKKQKLNHRHMATTTIIIIVGIVGLTALRVWRSISTDKAEKKSQKLIEDFLSAVSISFTRANQRPSEDTRTADVLAIDIKNIIQKETSDNFDYLMFNIETVPKMEFKFLNDDPVTKQFDAKVFKLTQESCKWVLDFRGKDKKSIINSYRERVYMEIYKILLEDLLKCKSKK